MPKLRYIFIDVKHFLPQRSALGEFPSVGNSNASTCKEKKERYLQIRNFTYLVK